MSINVTQKRESATGETHTLKEHKKLDKKIVPSYIVHWIRSTVLKPIGKDSASTGRILR